MKTIITFLLLITALQVVGQEFDFKRNLQQENRNQVIRDNQVSSFTIKFFKIKGTDTTLIENQSIFYFNKDGNLTAHKEIGFGGYIDTLIYKNGQLKKMIHTWDLEKSVTSYKYSKNRLHIVEKETLNLKRNTKSINKHEYSYKGDKLKNVVSSDTNEDWTFEYKSDTVIEHYTNTSRFFNCTALETYVFHAKNLIEIYRKWSLSDEPYQKVITYTYTNNNLPKNEESSVHLLQTCYLPNDLIDYETYLDKKSGVTTLKRYEYNWR